MDARLDVARDWWDGKERSKDQIDRQEQWVQMPSQNTSRTWSVSFRVRHARSLRLERASIDAAVGELAKQARRDPVWKKVERWPRATVIGGHPIMTLPSNAGSREE
ncbi:hypothetical protein MKZ38_000008 [Zalerion maritima]|uniref:Uncharacterized protein n=1 Tax=Zalerion maritima TaxID=339359 RepID=A0AAD5RG24_9PEZI|nr:hypothetical protein MKZ38_000008 [Zalerion maritima]